jgi:diguanylate cyclase (GGDEF)-like protein
VFFRAAFFSGLQGDHVLSLLQRGSSTAPIDPGMLKHLISRGSYHFEEGVWESAGWSKKVLDDVGEWARPYLKTIHDEISKLKRNFNQMLRVLYLDALTLVHNRVYFELRISEELERANRFKGRTSLISADIDFFKSLNDESGHDKGNEVLRSVSTILKQQMRKMDMVCRYSDDDFLIIVPETTADSAVRVAEKLRRAVEVQDFPGISRPVTISCGVADYPTHGTNREELVYAADTALSLAKSSGRNRVTLATKTPSM